MTPEQLAVARQHVEHHRGAFGYDRSNVEFVHGYIEHLAGCGIRDELVDVVGRRWAVRRQRPVAEDRGYCVVESRGHRERSTSDMTAVRGCG